MRRALELVLLLGGALALALGLDLLRQQASTGWEPIALAASGGMTLLLGVGLSLNQRKKPAARRLPAAAAGPLGTATLAFAGNEPPKIVSRDADLDVAVDGDGTVRLKLKDGQSAGRLICRAGSAYFNTLRQDREEAAIKLIGPMPPLVRLELWDAGLRESA